MIKVGKHWINLAAITHIQDDRDRPDGDVAVYFMGDYCLTLDGDDADALMEFYERQQQAAESRIAQARIQPAGRA